MPKIILRDVMEADLLIFFEQQRDVAANPSFLKFVVVNGKRGRNPIITTSRSCRST